MHINKLSMSLGRCRLARRLRTSHHGTPQEEGSIFDGDSEIAYASGADERWERANTSYNELTPRVVSDDLHDRRMHGFPNTLKVTLSATDKAYGAAWEAKICTTCSILIRDV